MSDEPGAVHHGAIGSGDGVDMRRNPPDTEAPSGNGYSQPPEWLGPIEARMDELRDQNLYLAEQLQQRGYDDGGYDDYDDEDPSDEDWEALGIDPREIDEIESEPERGERGDVFDLIDSSIEGRMADIEAEQTKEERNAMFEDLRAQYPLLQDPDACYAIVKRAQRLVENLDPDLLDTPAFVDLIEATTKAVMMERTYAGESLTAAQSPGDWPRVQLESGVGASVHEQRAPDEPDWGQKILDAAERLRPRI